MGTSAKFTSWAGIHMDQFVLSAGHMVSRSAAGTPLGLPSSVITSATKDAMNGGAHTS